MFDLMDESSGTRNLLFLAGPVLDILKQDLTLLVDELDTSLHTHLVQSLVRLFRRDQVWFVEKNKDQSSELFGLLEFSPRKNEALERGYLQGRYGAVPIISGRIGLPH